MIKGIFKKSAPNNIRLSKRGDRHNIFRIQRFKNDHGFYVYALENVAENRKIFIPRFVFGRFRAAVRTLLHTELSKAKAEPFEKSVSFLNRDYFFFKSSRMDLDHLIVQDIEERSGSSGYLTVSRRCLTTLDALLYSEDLQHPNDVLEEIISYHRLFQFSFVKGSKSITSDLSLRRDVLQQTAAYLPRLAEKIENTATVKKTDTNKASRSLSSAGQENTKANAALYQPKLGERFHEKNIQVDYEEVFGDKKVTLGVSGEKEENRSGTNKKVLSQFPVPLSALEIKTFDAGTFNFELSTQNASEFRERFIKDRSCEFYLGFEIVDALFTHNRVLKTFQFPLYYMKVTIRESGTQVNLTARQDGRIYLNHLALANLVEKFDDFKAGSDSIDSFFKTLLAQDISIDSLNDRIHVVRHLPVRDEVFDRTREVLFGYQEENGKGGLLAGLKVKGIECDLHSVYLYRAPSLLSPVDQGLEHDLNIIDAIAHQQTSRFYDSLLGKFLTPELRGMAAESRDAESLTWIPGSPPRSTRALIDSLNHHDLVLLEGPPGTGKTFAIMNLIIHCICKRQRVLIVSDQQAAIEALIEKLQDYLIGDDRGSPLERQWNDLLFSALKVVDALPNVEKSLEEVVNQISPAFKLRDQGATGSKASGLDKKLRNIKVKITQCTQRISDEIQRHLSDDIAFEMREPKKDSRENVSALVDFLIALRDKNNANSDAIERFIQNRLKLVENDMAECYPYFKIPAAGFENEIHALKNDEILLSSLLNDGIDSKRSFSASVSDHPRHELIRYLESRLSALEDASSSGIKSVAKKMHSAFRSPFLRDVQLLCQMVQDQITLLERDRHWSDELWSLLRDTHESIRLQERPNRAFALYQRYRGYGATEQGQSVQGYLEQMEDLYQQHDRLIKERFVASLRETLNKATTTRRGAGTDAITSIMALAENLKQFSTISESGSVFDEFKQKLYETFPVWIVRKQIVPLLLPCSENSFDLVVIDEATQCRVDDAMSLLFRAKKMLVVGDDRQTVLQKNSIIDDYLFKDHELDEHLRSTQARGFKGGGSHIFALVKAIKQASVMLDEHYRCPADIIHFSNHYVYNNELKVMQWRLPETSSPVEVDSSERRVENSKKPTSGKFKGIETGMIDRFLEYVTRTIKRIERESGTRINTEADVALCYFLMKNEPYVKAVKSQFLADLKRGEDILDGAGAALQGKERNYIFYLWDITRYNIGAFKQGDDADKRKGELNVLMSRPKKRAFHFLHRNFEQLEPGRTNITHYLWRALQEQNQQTISHTSPGQSRALLAQLLTFTLDNSGKRSLSDIQASLKTGGISFRENIAVGDARRIVDLIAFNENEVSNNRQTLGLVDLTDFGAEEDAGQSVVDYFFQLKRAAPKIDPVFLFPYELIDENSQTFRSLTYKLEHLGRRKETKDIAV